MNLIQEYYSEDGSREALIEIRKSSYIISLREKNKNFKVMKDEKHHISYWEDCCENWVMYWGEFHK
jgi:cyclopropane fatty-acyl-phospholipid synthase-like methyltransferase